MGQDAACLLSCWLRAKGEWSGVCMLCDMGGASEGCMVAQTESSPAENRRFYFLGIVRL